MSKDNTPVINDNTPESKKNTYERTLDDYLFERRTKHYWLSRPIVRTTKKKPSRIVKLKKPKAKEFGNYVIKPGNCFAHRMIDVEECTK